MKNLLIAAAFPTALIAGPASALAYPLLNGASATPATQS
jgi:hypothetical protein